MAVPGRIRIFLESALFGFGGVVAIMSEKKLLFQAKNIYKSFGPTKALVDVSLDLYTGEVVGLIGENGSGKSTLTTIIARIQKGDSGEMFLHGQPYDPADVIEATAKGVCMVTQEQATFEDISVAANIFIGEEKKFAAGPIMNVPRMKAEAKKALEMIGVSYIDVSTLAGKLAFEDRKLIEIARAVYMDPDILIIDETSTTLGKKGRDILYSVINKMRFSGKAVIFISHDIDEIMEVCDRVTILRDGHQVAEIGKKDFTGHDIKQQMVGREIAENFYRTDYDRTCSEEVALRAEHIAFGSLRDISFDVHKGEIVGVGGLADCGMHDLGKILFGLERPDLGKVETGSGKEIKKNTDAIKSDFAYISKNRDREALFSVMSIRDNICIASLNKLANSLGLISNKKEKSFVKTWTDELQVKMDNINQYVMYLSGGNKQKVAVAKWLGFAADVFILDCPTRGIDVGVKAAIYKLLTELKAQGKAIIMISEELPEVIGMSDRILILKDGVISGEFKRSPELTESFLINYMI